MNDAEDKIVSLNCICQLHSPTKKTISSRTIIGLEVDPPAPFKYFGKSILETTGRLALSIALSEIGNAFVQVLQFFVSLTVATIAMSHIVKLNISSECHLNLLLYN